MEQSLVSVVTITRNRGSLLKRCIESVLSQTYQNIEHVIVDGASEDNTDDVVASFHDPRLRFYKLDYNWPIKETIDYGISLCQGKYITFLDSDDEYLPEKVEKQVNLIESLAEDYGFVYCWMTYYDNQSKQLLKIHKPELKGDVRDEVIIDSAISGTPTLLFRTELLKKLDGWKSVDEIGIVSDWDLCARACQISKVDYVAESLVNVYENHGSIRQSERSYYDKIALRTIRFDKYFLEQFKENFQRHPERAKNRYYSLARCYSMLGQRKESIKWLYKYMKFNSDFRNSLKAIIGIIIAK